MLLWVPLAPLLPSAPDGGSGRGGRSEGAQPLQRRAQSGQSGQSVVPSHRRVRRGGRRGAMSAGRAGAGAGRRRSGAPARRPASPGRRGRARTARPGARPGPSCAPLPGTSEGEDGGAHHRELGGESGLWTRTGAAPSSPRKTPRLGFANEAVAEVLVQSAQAGEAAQAGGAARAPRAPPGRCRRWRVLRAAGGTGGDGSVALQAQDSPPRGRPWCGCHCASSALGRRGRPPRPPGLGRTLGSALLDGRDLEAEGPLSGGAGGRGGIRAPESRAV